MKSARVMGIGSTPEMDLLCACLAPGRLRRIADGQWEGRSVDWPRFFALATNHHVVPLVYRALAADAANAAGIPAEWLAQFRSRRTAIAAYNLRATAMLHRHQRLMESQGIQLIPARYAAALQNWSLEKAGGPPLDLKPVLVSHALTGPASAAFMAAACQRVPIDEKRFLWAPGPEAMLLAVCLDGASEMWFKLSSVADAGALLEKYADRDWENFLGAAVRLGQRRSLLVGAGLAEELLGCDLPPAFREGDRQDPVARRLARQAAERLRALAPRHAIVGRQNWFALRTRERLRDRLRFVSRTLFVPGAFELAALRLPGVLYPLHSLVRPVRLAWDLFVRKGRSRRLTVRAADGKVATNAKGA